jgi:hypothetical protein
MGNMKFTTFDLGGHAQGNKGFFVRNKIWEPLVLI